MAKLTGYLIRVLVFTLMIIGGSTVTALICKANSDCNNQDICDYTGKCDSVCDPNPCGINAQCTGMRHRPVCSCPDKFEGNPLSHCEKLRPQCLADADCDDDSFCFQNGKCHNACLSETCGINALCTVRRHLPVCSCPDGFVGDPFSSCLREEENLCTPSPCGTDAICELINKRPICKCKTGYKGDPLNKCSNNLDCLGHSNCSIDQKCTEGKCISVCKKCGKGATCSVIFDHQAVCDCPHGFLGNPLEECLPECLSDLDCSSDRPACLQNLCWKYVSLS